MAVQNIQEDSFYGLDNLKELHLEENRLRDLSNFTQLSSLERLYLGLNRITDYHQLEKLNPLHNLVELSIISNPVGHGKWCASNDDICAGFSKTAT